MYVYEEWLDEENSAEARLEEVAREGIEPQSSAQMLTDFVDRTPMLSPWERAELLSGVLEYNDDDENIFGGNAAQTFGGISNLAGNILNIAGGLTQAFAGNNRQAQQAGAVLRGIGTGAQMIGGIANQFGAPRRRQVPSLPGRGPARRTPTPPRRPPAPTRPPGGALSPAQVAQLNQQRMMQQRQLQQQRQMQMQQQRQQGAQGGQANAAALVSMLMSNPQLQRALQQAVMQGRAGRREVVMEVPGESGGTRSVAIPLGAVMNTVAALASQAMVELNEQTHESDPEVPEYLLGEDGQYIVDPADPDQRAALVLHYMRGARHVEYDAATQAGDAWAEHGDFGEDYDDGFGDFGEDYDDLDY